MWVNEEMPLTKMNAEVEQKGEDALKGIQTDDSTNLSGGLFASIQQIKAMSTLQERDNPGKPQNAECNHYLIRSR